MNPSAKNNSFDAAASGSGLVSRFERDWKSLADEAEMVKREGLLPLRFKDIDGTETEWTVEDFDRQMANLKGEKFTISVCGMVKAGKSTFLNALLFGEDILPAFDTPMTAKLNFIEYTEEKSHFIVNFYSREEWQELQSGLDEENLAQLEERIQKCSEQGYDEDNYIGAPPQREGDLRQLEAYVSDPKSGKGKCTPFVKDVHIFIHNSSIREVRIVDTPGLNDPNVINSRETIKWIKNTHALIFLLPNKGLDESSLKFFDTHLLGTRPSNRVWVINKIDDITEEDLQKTKAYIRQLGQEEEFRQKDLFGRDEKLCGYSALISMLRNMYAKGAELTEDQLYHLDNVTDEFNPDPDNLQEVIGARLYQNIGVKRITAGFTTIHTIYSQHLKELEKTIMSSTMVIEDGQKNDAELQKELDALGGRKADFGAKLASWRSNLSDEVSGEVRAVVGGAWTNIEGLDRKMQNQVDRCRSKEGLQGLAYVYRNECSKIFSQHGELGEALNKCKSSLQAKLQLVITKIKNLFIQNDIKGIVNFTPLDNCLKEFKFSVDDLLGNIKDEIEKKLPSNWFTELFTFSSTMQYETKKVFSKLIGDINKELEENIKKLQTIIEKQIDVSFAEFTKNIEMSILEKQKYLESNKEVRQKKVEVAKQTLEDATGRKKRIGEMQRAFKSRFPQEIAMKG